MYIRKAEKMRLVGILVFITCFLSFYTYAEAGSGKSPVQGEFNVQAVKLKSILPDFMKFLGLDVESHAVCDCFLTSYEYVPVDRFVNEEYVETTRHPNFDIIRFLRAVSFFQTAIPPFCTVWLRAAYRYEICIKAVNADSSIVLVCADVIGWEKCFSWHTFRSNGELERQFLIELTKFIKDKC